MGELHCTHLPVQSIPASLLLAVPTNRGSCLELEDRRSFLDSSSTEAKALPPAQEFAAALMHRHLIQGNMPYASRAPSQEDYTLLHVSTWGGWRTW